MGRSTKGTRGDKSPDEVAGTSEPAPGEAQSTAAEGAPAERPAELSAAQGAQLTPEAAPTSTAEQSSSDAAPSPTGPAPDKTTSGGLPFFGLAEDILANLPDHLQDAGLEHQSAEAVPTTDDDATFAEPPIQAAAKATPAKPDQTMSADPLERLAGIAMSADADSDDDGGEEDGDDEDDGAGDARALSDISSNRADGESNTDYSRDGSGEATERERFIQLVTFYLNQEEYGLPIRQVQEINRVSEVTRVPNAPDHVLGVMNLRGRIVPVIELKRRLRVGATDMTRDTRIVVVEHGTKILGLVVDRVAQVLNVSLNAIERTPEEVVAVNENYTVGVGKVDDRMIIILDLERVVLGSQAGKVAEAY